MIFLIENNFKFVAKLLSKIIYVQDQLSIPVQIIKGPKTSEEKKSHHHLTPGSVYRTRIGDRQILKIKLPTTV